MFLLRCACRAEHEDRVMARRHHDAAHRRHRQRRQRAADCGRRHLRRVRSVLSFVRCCCLLHCSLIHFDWSVVCRIHKAAGPQLKEECEKIGCCPTGETVITKGFDLPSKHVLHSVGPTNGSEKHLASCYRTCLDRAVEHKVRTLAFCCIATGIFGFENAKAALIALGTTRDWSAVAVVLQCVPCGCSRVCAG